jgi:putative peptidoglycan lipid II flippase
MPALTHQRISQAAIILLLARLFSIFFGMFVSMFVASTYGKSYLTDAFFIAIFLPLNFSRIVRATFGPSVIPVFSQVIEKKGEGDAWKFASSLCNFLFIAGAVIVLAVALGRTVLVHLLAPGLTGAGKAAGAGFILILAPVIFVNLLSHLGESLSHTYKHFLYPAIGSLTINIGTILGLFLLSNRFGLKSGCIGFLAGGVLQLAVILYSLRKYLKLYRPVLHLNSPEVRMVGIQFLPVLFCGSIGILTQWINQVFLSTLGSGKISVLTYANNLVLVIPNLLMFSFMRAVFPSFTQKAATNDRKDLGQMHAKVLSLASYFVIPIMAGLLILIRPTINLVYFRGNMDLESIHMITNVSIVYIVGIIFISINLLQQALLFALKRAKDVARIMGLSLVVQIVFNLILIQVFDYVGVAISIVIASIFRFVLFRKLVRNHLEPAHVGESGSTCMKVIFASVIMACVMGVIYFAEIKLFGYPNSVIARILFLGHMVIIGVITFAFASHKLKIQELPEILLALRKIFR